MVPIASSSDCQFCSVLLQKSGATRYSPRDERVEPVAQPLLVVRHPSGDRLRRPRQHEDGGHREDERVRVEPGPPAPDPGPGRRVGRRVLADELLLVGLAALVPGLLGLRRAALHEPHRERDVEHELEELRLPVLGDVDGERPTTSRTARARSPAAERSWPPRCRGRLPTPTGRPASAEAGHRRRGTASCRARRSAGAGRRSSQAQPDDEAERQAGGDEAGVQPEDDPHRLSPPPPCSRRGRPGPGPRDGTPRR